MDVINTYTYKMSTGLISAFQVLSLVVAFLAGILFIYGCIKVIQVCNIYIYEHRRSKNESMNNIENGRKDGKSIW